jgi:hypothetical protein
VCVSMSVCVSVFACKIERGVLVHAHSQNGALQNGVWEKMTTNHSRV